MKDFLLTLKYARRELRSGFAGFYIFIACLILGVGAISSVQSLSRGMAESLAYDGKYILGGDLSMRMNYEPAPKEQLDFLRKEMGPITTVVETRAMARRADDTDASLVELKGVDHFYPLYGSMSFVDENDNVIDKQTQDLLLNEGVDANGKDIGDWGAVVEKELLTRLSLHIGDKLMIGEVPFVIRGIIKREPDRVSNMGFSLAPRVMINSFAFGQTGLTGMGSQVQYSHRVIMPYVKTPEDLAAAQKKIAEAFPDATWRGRNFYNSSPRAERTIDRLTLFLTLIGLATLLVGGVGISNAVRGYLDAKLANIATLKCLGAPQKFVLNVYLTQVFILATFGILVGVLLGILVSQGAGSYVTEKFSLSDRVGIYPDALVLSATFGFLTTLVFSLWPLGRAAKVSPADLFRDLVSHSDKKPSSDIIATISGAALIMAFLAVTTSTNQYFAMWFVFGAAVSFVVFYVYSFFMKKAARRVSHVKWPEMRMALANLYRPGNVSTSIILSLGLGLTVLVSVALVEYNFSRILKEDVAVDAPSFFFLDIQQDQKDAFAAKIESFEGVRNLQMTASLRGRIAKVNGKDAESAIVNKNEDWVVRSDRGFTYTSKLPAYSRITEGEWWPADYSGPPIISISTDVASAFGIGVGDKLSLLILGREIEAEVKNVREIDWGSFTMNFAVTFAPGTLEGAPATWLATAIVDENQETAMQTAIAKTFPNITVVRVKEALQAAEKMLRSASIAVRASASLALVAGVLVLAGGIAAARRRHIYDSIVLKVLGATHDRILKTFLMEYALLGVLTVFIASALGSIAAYGVITGIMQLQWKFSFSAIGWVTALCLGITLLAGFAGTLRALRQKPAPYLRNL